MDRDEPDLLLETPTEDVIIEGPGFRRVGMSEALALPAVLREMYLCTQHLVQNQTFDVDGASAQGETYCTASHVLVPQTSSGHEALVWALRYQDRYCKQDGVWRIHQRRPILHWNERRPVEFTAPAQS